MRSITPRLAALAMALGFSFGCGGSAPPAAASGPSVAARPGAPPATSTRALAMCPGPTPRAPIASARQVLQSGHVGGLTLVSASRSGLLATASQFDDTLRIWDVRRRALLGTARLDTHGVELVWQEDGTLGALRPMAALDEAAPDELTLFTPGGAGGQATMGRFGPVVRTATGPRLGILARQDADYVLQRADKPAVRLRLPKGASTLDEVTLARDGRTLIARVPGGAVVYRLDAQMPVPQVIALAEVQSFAASPLGDFVVAGVEPRGGGSGFEVVVVRTESGATSGLRSDHPREDNRSANVTTLWESSSLLDAVGVAVSPDGTLIAAAGDSSLTVWEAATGRALWTATAREWDPKGATWAAGYSDPIFMPEGGLLVTQATAGPLEVRDARSGRVHGRMGDAVREPTALAWAGPGRLLAGSYGHLAIWDVTRGVVARSFDAEDLLRFALAPGGNVITARVGHCPGPGRQETNLWLDGWTGLEPPAALVAQQLPGRQAGCGSAAPGSSGAMKWPPDRGAAGTPRMVPGFAMKLDLAAGIALVASKPAFLAPADAVLDLQTGAVTPLVGVPPRTRGDDVTLAGGWAFIPGKASGRSAVGVWDARTGTWTATLSLDPVGSQRGGGSLAGVAPDGRHVAIALGGRVAVHELPSATKVLEVDIGQAIVTAVGFGASARDLWIGARAYGPERGEIHRIEAGAARLFATDPGGPPEQLVLDPSSSRLATIDDDGAVRIWSVASGRLLAALVEFDDDEHLAFTPGGAYAGTAEVAERVGWVFDAPVEAFRFEQFATAFALPDVVRRRLADEDVDASARPGRPPRLDVQVEPPAVTGSTAATSTVTLRVRASSPARVALVRAFVEGRAVASKTVCAAEAELTLDAPLVAGTNRVTVVAYDDAGLASNPAVLDVTASAVPARRPDLHVIAMGVSRYPHLPASQQLDFADDDARGIAATFGKLAGEGQPYASVRSTVLVDDEVTAASVPAALAGLATMRPEDVAVVFFAGHGVKPGGDGDMVLLTSRAAPNLASVLAHGVGWSSLADALGRARGRVVVLLDACHSGHVTRELVVQNDALASALVRGGRTGSIVFAAAKGRQYSYEPSGTRALVLEPAARPLVAGGAGSHGFFTGALLASVEADGTDANGDGMIQVSELVDAVTDRVVVATKGKQTPWVARREIVGDFSLAPARKRSR